ncbi:MAG: aminobenzoyl-glutamate transporter [Ignavibacteriales bacterium CG18_big_fil_WC_8_21_14_2_50_31_20]|nr:MAG: aminobenzoyl-glutamate transporter [Ignavibacteriales bacterium CG18_big_fil_WC_8_21_14_2_50_31_20]
MKKPVKLFNRFLNIVEKGGNALPNPSTLFAIFALLTVLASAVAYSFELQAIHPVTGEIITVNNLLSESGLKRIMLEMVTNFTNFAPLGIVLVALLGLGVAEGSGFLNAVIRIFVLSAPKALLTFIIVFTGVLSNMASTVGYVLLIPLAGVVFLAVKRHPIVGMAAAYAGISGGYSANLFIGTVDPLLAGLSQEAARIIDPQYIINPTANYYFMVVSTFLISFAGTWVTEKIVEPRLGKYTGDVTPEKIEPLSAEEKRGLKFTFITFIGVLFVIVLGIYPENGILRGENNGILNSPLVVGVVALIFIVASLLGIAYGIGSRKFKNDNDIIKSMDSSMKSVSTYLVLVFFASQFVSYFNWTNLGLIIAIEGANLITHLGVGLIPLMIMFIILSGTINLFMGSASAKWALMAPIFVPMFMLLGYSPELTQAGFRIGDSVTNVISPMMSFFALIIVYFQKYDENAGIGTIVSTMLSYSIIFFVLWTILLIIWLFFNLPLGPNSELYYQMLGS